MLSLAERCRIAVHAARATAVAMDAMIASTLTCEKLCTWPQVIAKCPVSMPAASHTPATTMRALLALVLSVGMVSRALTAMISRPLRAGTSSSTWCASSAYMNRPTTSRAQTMQPMHRAACEALMRRLDGSTENAVCSTRRWHTCTTSDAKIQNSRLWSSGGNPTANATVASCQIETISTPCSHPCFLAVIIRPMGGPGGHWVRL